MLDKLKLVRALRSTENLVTVFHQIYQHNKKFAILSAKSFPSDFNNIVTTDCFRCQRKFVYTHP